MPLVYHLPLSDSGSGVVIDNRTPSKAGLSIQIAIDDTERLLDTTPLLGTSEYPMIVELEARDRGVYLHQGDSGVTLSGVNLRLQSDEWGVFTVDSEEDAYFALQTAEPTTSGTLVATRRDEIGG